MKKREPDAAQRLRPVFIGAAVLLVVLLGVFAYALAKSQQQQRDDAKRRFGDRAEVAAAVNESIFTLATQQAAAVDAAQLGGPKVPDQTLAARIVQSRALYELVVDATTGKVLASTGPVASGTGRNALVAKALKSRRTEYSKVISLPNGHQIIEGATPFASKFGPRVDVTSTDAVLLGQFLGGFLKKLPTVSNAKSYVIDPQAFLIAQPGSKTKPGTKLSDTKLAGAVMNKDAGSYDGGRYFSSAPIAGTPWRIVLAAATKNLYEDVKTTVSWLIFGAFVLVSAVGLFLVRRILLANAELERADLSRQHALEINDNVVQRLVLAKYALDRGATETSQQKLAETLRETQQLVTSLLEEKEIAPGALRRETPAPTDSPPEPPTPSWQKADT